MDRPTTWHFDSSGNAFVSPGIPSVSRIQSCRDRSTQWCNGVIIQKKISISLRPASTLHHRQAEITEQQIEADCAKFQFLPAAANSFTSIQSMPKARDAFEQQAAWERKAAPWTTAPSRRPTQQRGANSGYAKASGVKPAPADAKAE